MREALHICSKDLRQFRMEIAIVLALTALLVILGARPYNPESSGHASLLEIVSAALAVTWCVLTARVIRAEQPVGDRQFWLTRPYRRSSLIVGKAMFLALTIHLPMLIAQGMIVGANGFPFESNVAGLLWEQLLILVVFTLPAAALAAVTETLPQFLAVAVLGFVVLANLTELLHTLGRPQASLGPIEWIRSTVWWTVMGGAAFTILLLQYLRRRTNVSRAIAVAVACSLPAMEFAITKPMAAAIQSGFSKLGAPSITVALDAGRPKSEPAQSRNQYLVLPVTVSGVPKDGYLRVDRATVTMESARGSHSTDAWVNFDKGGYTESFRADTREFDVPVRLRTQAMLTYFGNPVSRLVAGGAAGFEVAGVGRCWSETSFPTVMLFCRSPLRAPGRLVLAESGNRRGVFTPTSYSPFPAQFTMSSFQQFGVFPERGPEGSNGDELRITTMEPLAHFRAEWTLENVQLADFQLGR